MPDFATSDPKTLVLMSALQMQPRASWSTLAPILGSSATTLARRWKTLTEQNLAWITCSPAFPTDLASTEGAAQDWFFLAPHGTTAYVEVTCRPGERESVIASLTDDPRCWTIACTSGSRDVTVAVTLPTSSELDDFVHHRIGMLPGVRSMRTNPLRGFLQAPSNWRIGALTPRQRDALARLTPRTRPHRKPERVAPRTPTELELAVMRELAIDGRASATGIAERVGYSVSSVNDAIAHVLTSGAAEWRLDFAQAQFGWDVMATLSLHAPQSRMAEIGAQLRRFSLEVREAVSLIGGANLQVHVWTKQLETIDAVEEMLDAQFPDVRVSDRWLSTRFAKRAGVILDASGRCVRVVPMFPPSAS